MGEGLKNPRLPVKLNGGTLLFINYFGKNSLKIISSLQTLRQNHTGFIIEDNVPSSLNPDAASPHSDYIITSYRKFLPQPDGALLTCDFPVEYDLLPVDETFLSQRLIGKILRAERGRPEYFLSLLSESENRLDSFIQPRTMSYLSAYLLKRSNIEEISELRRRNWFILHKLMQTAAFESRMNPLFDNLQPGEVPLGFPITISPALRNDLRRHLASRNIFCAVHWPLPPTDDLEFAADIHLSNSILTLPIDQRVTPEALNYMAEQIKQFLSNYSK